MIRKLAAFAMGVVAAALLSGCGGSPDAATSRPEASASASSSTTTATTTKTTDSTSPRAIAKRADAGECVSDAYGKDAGQLTARWNALPDSSSPADVLIPAYEAMLAQVPADDDACTEGDRETFSMWRESLIINIADLKNG